MEREPKPDRQLPRVEDIVMHYFRQDGIGIIDTAILQLRVRLDFDREFDLAEFAEAGDLFAKYPQSGIVYDAERGAFLNRGGWV